MKLASDAIAGLGMTLPAWTFAPERGGTLTREFVFRDFPEAFGFMTQAAVHAQSLDHHPEWSNVYNRVRVTLTTHDVQGLSDKDVTLARVMDRIAEPLLRAAGLTG